MSEQMTGAFSTSYAVQKRRVQHSGLYQAPVSGPAGNEDSELIRMHAPIERVIVSWTASKVGAPPEVPSPVSADPNLVLLEAEQGALIPSLVAEGGAHVWTLTGTYVYALIKPRGLTANFSTGKMPFDPGSAQDNMIPSTVFRTDLMDKDT